MAWLRNNPFISTNRTNNRALLSTEEECDPTACYDSFRQHWQQALKIIKRNQQMPSHDDVLGVVNHLEQIVSLLLYDVKKIDQITLPISNTSRCLEYLISENILETLYDWGFKTGKYVNAVRVEQLKIYELLVSQLRHLLLVHEPFVRPLLKVLASCQGEVFHTEVEKHLVALLYQLCIVLMQNVDLVDLFFLYNLAKPKFIIFALLITFVHREDNTGMQARDALLLCLSLSKKNANVKEYISEHSNLCALLASGLGGLYSMLPHTLNDIAVPDWHRLTPDDVNDIKHLSAFLTSFEFSNLVSQVAHPHIAKQVQEFTYMGFLIPILGRALLEVTYEEQIAVTAYLEFMLRTVSNPGLLHAMLKFLLQVEYDGQRLLDILLDRIDSSDPQLSLVSLALFETLIDLNCEDVMLELVFRHLRPCLHLMASQRRAMLPLDAYCRSFERLLKLAPNCCIANNQSGDSNSSPTHSSVQPLLMTTGANWHHYGGYSSLYGNYHAYLCDARTKISTCQAGCSVWTNSYAGLSPTSTMLPDTSDHGPSSLQSISESIGYESLKYKVESPSSDDSTLSPPVWQMPSHKVPSEISRSENTTALACVTDQNVANGSSETSAAAASTAGPFLTILMEKLRNMLSNTLYVNLHLTGIISRLAAYPQPLLRTYLLDHSIVLQPNVPSLFQIVGSLKQKIDEFMERQPDASSLVSQARTFLLERETRLVNARRPASDSATSICNSSVNGELESTTTGQQSQAFQRNGPKRRSLTQSLSSISNMFRRESVTTEPNIDTTAMQLIVTHHEETFPIFNDAQHVALCAVLLDEWLKELAALAQEHTISQLAALFK